MNTRKLTKAMLILLALSLIGAHAAMAKTTLTWLVPGPYERQQVWDALAQEFNRRHTDIQVERVPVANFTDYYPRIATMMAGGIAPDVVFSQNPSTRAEGWFLDLTPYIERDPDVDLDAYIPAAVQLGQAVGRDGIYSLPNHLAAHGLYYNVGVVQDKGLADPNLLVKQDAWSWEDFISFGQKIIERNPDGSIKLGISTVLFFPSFLQTYGAHLVVEEDGQEIATVDTPEAREAIEMWTRLHTEAELIVNGQHMKQFLNGEMAMDSHWNDFWPVYKEAEFQVDVVRYPWGTTRETSVAGAGWSIPNNASHPDEAWEFLKFLAGDFAQDYFGRVAGGIPALTHVATDVWSDPSWGPEHKSEAYLEPIIQHGVLSDNAVSPAFRSGFPSINRTFWNLRQGKLSPSEAIEQLESALRGTGAVLRD